MQCAASCMKPLQGTSTASPLLCSGIYPSSCLTPAFHVELASCYLVYLSLDHLSFTCIVFLSQRALTCESTPNPSVERTYIHKYAFNRAFYGIGELLDDNRCLAKDVLGQRITQITPHMVLLAVPPFAHPDQEVCAIDSILYTSKPTLSNTS